MNRRRFLAAAGALPLLAACDAEVPPEAPLELGTLEPRSTLVKGWLDMHYLASEAAAPGAPPMVLVHGSGLSGRYMIPVARELTGDFHVYVPDLPGYGLSGDPGAALGVPQLADWLIAWMDAVGLECASMLGNSFGCQVIADLAARYHARVERALLQGPTTPPEERSGFWQFVRWRQNQRWNPDWLGPVTMQDYRHAGLWRMVRNFHYQLTDPIEDKMPRIQAPVLVIRGEHDPITHQEFAQMLASLAPRGELAVIPDVAHTLVSVAPVALAQVTRDYMAKAA
jgi:2-hydroxy-6-oxonona-2,4-dienedioate hydrolase